MLAGTPAYMAPEQLNGLAVDARADVFAFGVLLYEYACGTHPFDAPSPLGILARVLESDAPPLDSLRPDLPAQLSDIVERCLRKSPADRFASAVEIAAALSRDDSAAPRSVRAKTWWRAHQVAMVVLYLLASVLAWQVKEWHPGAAGIIFLALGVAATTGGVFRGHLLFTERLVGAGGAGFITERRRATPATLIADLLIALALVADGVIMSRARPVAAGADAGAGRRHRARQSGRRAFDNDGHVRTAAVVAALKGVTLALTLALHWAAVRDCAYEKSQV